MATFADTPPPVDPESAFITSTKPIKSPLAVTPDLDPPGAAKFGLTAAEVEQFRELGYVIKRGLVPPQDFSAMIDLWWQQPPVLSAGVQRDDPGTWVSPGRRWPEHNRWGLAQDWMGGGAWPGPKDERPGADIGERVGRLPYKLTRDIANDVWRWHGIGHDPAFVAASAAHPRVLRMIELLLGGPVKRPRRSRGIYALFPKEASEPASHLGPHMDANPTELVVSMIVEDIAPGGGGFTIYPGSARSLYPTSAQAHNWVATADSDLAMDEIKASVQPLEFTGKAGDVLFCHGWTVHSAGIHEGERIRMAVFNDINRVRPRGHLRWTAAGKNGGPRINCDMDGYLTIPPDTDDDPADGRREVTQQWLVDSNEFVLDRRPPFDDMFEEWNLGQRDATGHIVDEPAWWDKYELPFVRGGSVPRGGGGIPAIPLDAVATYEGEGRWRLPLRGNEWMERRP